MVQPKLASDVLRQMSPRKMLGPSFFNSNRYSSMRENSPASSVRGFSRDRSASVKRKLDQPAQVSYADALLASKNAEILLSNLDICSTEVAKVQSLCSGLNDKIGRLDLDDPMKEILSDLCNAVAGLSTAQASIITVIRDPNVLGSRPVTSGPSRAWASNPPSGTQSQFVSLGQIPKKARQNRDNPSQDATGLFESTLLWDGGKPPKEPPSASTKFKEAVKDAERASLIFNLDMGSFPTINPEKMATQATKALSAMAAKKEGKQGGIPSEEAVAAIDDAMGVAKSISFFGKATKTCRKNKDGTGGQYYTIPVKYSFKDRDTRMGVEAILREKCQIQCSTPYPPILRECIRQTINLVKEDYPEDFVRVNVDSNNFSLKVSLRAKGKESEWRKCGASIPLPNAALDITSRKIPEDMKMSLPIDIYTPGRESRRDRDNRLRQNRNEGGGNSPSQNERD